MFLHSAAVCFRKNRKTTCDTSSARVFALSCGLSPKRKNTTWACEFRRRFSAEDLSEASKWCSLALVIVSGFEPLAYRLGASKEHLITLKGRGFRASRSFFKPLFSHLFLFHQIWFFLLLVVRHILDLVIYTVYILIQLYNKARRAFFTGQLMVQSFPLNT